MKYLKKFERVGEDQDEIEDIVMSFTNGISDDCKYYIYFDYSKFLRTGCKKYDIYVNDEKDGFKMSKFYAAIKSFESRVGKLGYDSKIKLGNDSPTQAPRSISKFVLPSSTAWKNFNKVIDSILLIITKYELNESKKSKII
jgi:hypothetical protein